MAESKQTSVTDKAPTNGVSGVSSTRQEGKASKSPNQADRADIALEHEASSAAASTPAESNGAPLSNSPAASTPDAGRDASDPSYALNDILNTSISYTVSYRDIKRDGITNTAKVHTSEDLPFGDSKDTESLSANEHSVEDTSRASSASSSMEQVSDSASAKASTAQLAPSAASATSPDSATSRNTGDVESPFSSSAAAAPQDFDHKTPSAAKSGSAEVTDTSMANSKHKNKNKITSNPSPAANLDSAPEKQAQAEVAASAEVSQGEAQAASATSVDPVSPEAAPQSTQEAAAASAAEAQDSATTAAPKATAKAERPARSRGADSAPVSVNMLYDESPRLKIYDEQGQELSENSRHEAGDTRAMSVSQSTDASAADSDTALYDTEGAEDSEDQFDFSSLMADSIFGAESANAATSPSAKVPEPSVSATAPESSPNPVAAAPAASSVAAPQASAASSAPVAPATQSVSAPAASSMAAPRGNAEDAGSSASSSSASSGSGKGSIMDNGTMMAFGHTAIMGMENHDPNKPTFERPPKIVSGVSESDLKLIEQINALNKKQRRKSNGGSTSANTGGETKSTQTQSTTISSTAAPQATVIPEPLERGQNTAVATGSTNIIGANARLTEQLSESSAPASKTKASAAPAPAGGSHSGARTAFERLRSTLSSDQEAYASDARAAAAAASAAASSSTKASKAKASLNKSKNNHPVRQEPEISHVGGDFKPNYGHKFSGDEFGNALDNEVISGAGFGNAFDDGTLSGIAAPILRHHNTVAPKAAPADMNLAAQSQAALRPQSPVAPTSPADIPLPVDTVAGNAVGSGYMEPPQRLTAEDLEGYPAMVPNDLMEPESAASQPSPAYTYPQYGDDLSDVPVVDIQDVKREDDEPHYVVGSQRKQGEAFYHPQDEYVQAMANARDEAQSAPYDGMDAAGFDSNGGPNVLIDPEQNYHAPSYIQEQQQRHLNAPTAASNADDDIYPGVYATKLKRQQQLKLQQEQQLQQSPMAPESAQGYVADELPPMDLSSPNLGGAGAVNAQAQASLGDSAESLPHDDGEDLYPGVYATKLKRQQQAAAAAAAAEAAKLAGSGAGVDADAVSSQPLSGDAPDGAGAAQGAAGLRNRGHGASSLHGEDDIVAEPTGMGDGLLTQVDPNSIESNGNDSGPHYVVGPSKKAKMAVAAAHSDDNVPMYAVGVSRTNAEVEAKLRAERERMQLVQMGNYDDPRLLADPETRAQAEAEERAYEEALAEAARESMATSASSTGPAGTGRSVAAPATAASADEGLPSEIGVANEAQGGALPIEGEISAALGGMSADSGASIPQGVAPSARPAAAVRLGGGAALGGAAASGYPSAQMGSNGAERPVAADTKSARSKSDPRANRMRRDASTGQYNFANMPEKESVGFGLLLFLYLRQFLASFFAYTTLPSIMPHMAMRLGPSYPSSMAIPFFVVGMISGLLGYTINHSLYMDHAGLIAAVVYTLLLGLPAYRGIYKICTFTARRRHDMILLVASVMLPMLCMMWLFNTILVRSSGVYEATALLAIASMLSAATASTMMWNFPQDPIDSCGMMSLKGLFFVIVLCLVVSFGLLHYIVGLSVLGVSIVMRLIFGYCIARNQGTAQRAYVYALQLLTLLAILLDLILLKSQNYEILSFSSLELFEEAKAIISSLLGSSAS